MKTFTNLAHRAFKKCASLGTINKKRYYLFIITMLLTLGVTNAWGQTTVYTETFEDASYTTSTNYNNSTEKKHGPTNYQWGVLCGTPNTGAHNGSKAFAMRYYKSVDKTPTLTQYFDINSVDRIMFWAKTDNTNNKLNVEYSTNGGSSWSSLASNISVTTSYKEYTYDFPTQQSAVRLRFTMGTTTEKKSMFIDDVAFIKVSSGSEPETPVASLSANPTTIDFGTIYQGADVESKTVAVNFENLTGNVTYSGLSNPFTATGAISATGDEITISADASTIGEYYQTLTITSAADSKTAEVTVKMNVVEKPAPTGTFTLHTGALVEGDYVIVSTNSLKAEVNSDRLASLPVTISNDEIVDPDATTIWHIAKSGEYWTLYNANKAKYAASTGAKNKAALLDDGSDDKALWSASGTSTYEFVNKKNTEAAVNANLRYNYQNAENSRWACYSTSTGAALSLYRKAGTKYNVNISATTNGTVTADPTSAEAGTTITLTVTPAGGYVLDALTVTDASSNTLTVTNNEFTMPASDVTVTATFKENEKPAATLTLSKNGDEEPFPGSWKQDDVVTLPSITSDCVKEFVGWSANPTCNVAPEYAAGDSYTLAATAQTLYAVYADAVGGEPTWNRVTNLAALTSGGTFILGYEATAKSGEIIPMRTSGTATTSTAGYMYSGNADGTTSNNATLDMASISESSKFEIVLEASSIVDGAVNIKLGDNYLGNTDTKNNCKLFTSASINTAFTPTIGTNDVITLTIEANDTYTTLQFNNNSGSYRYAVYGGAQKDVVFYKKEITSSYSNYSTTCAAAPIATVNPTSVTAPAAGVNGTLEASYENVNTENVAVALFNDEACTETFTAGWLTASLDGDKNIAYTVAATTLYTERKAYIQLTAPEKTGATDPAVVVIPVTQAAKDKVFESLAELVAADLTAGDEVTVTLNNDVIKDFYIYSSKRCGVVFDVQKDGNDIKIYFNSQTTIDDWAVGGKLSGTLTNVEWTTYSDAWQLAPANTWAWANLTYTEPKAVSTVIVGGAPTKTTYVDGEAFDPAGLTVTVNYNDATSEVNPTGVTFEVTPATLTEGETSVSVTATYNTVSSAPYEVTGLTVNDIPTKTVAEFIAAGGTRCHLEGIVSGLTEGNSMKFGNFDLTDATGTIYVYGCLNGAGESQKFDELGVKNGDKIKVIADDYELYGGTKDEAKNVQYVSHISAATITIADITMEVGETKTIAATITPAAAVTYTIKENEANAISLKGNTIKALAEGTATITATVAEGATYLGNSVDFTVTVGPKTESEEVVILAELDGKWYAMKGAVPTGKSNQLDALEVTYFNGTLYNVAESDKASITWTRSIVDGKATFVNNGKYLKGDTDSDLTLSASVDDKCKWMWDDENGYYTTNSSGTIRTFLYRENFNFKNYAVSEAGNDHKDGNYSSLPVVIAPVYANGDVVYTRTVTNGNYGTICIPYASTSYSGAEFYEVSWLDEGVGLYLDQLTAGARLEAGKPYIFRATSTEIMVTCTGDAVAAPAEGENGLTGTFEDIAAGGVLVDNYIIAQNKIWVANDQNTLPANRAYINKGDLPTTEQDKLPGRRRVCMGENAETGVDNIITTDAPVKVIENGQLIIIRDGVKYNVQGIKL